MRSCINKILMMSCCFCLMLLPQSYAMGKPAYACDGAKLLVSKFINSQTNEDWDNIEANVYKLQYCKCEIAPVFYYIYRMKILLPNSQTLQGTSPDDFIANQKIEMREQIKLLRKCKENLYLPLIHTMIKQNFDSEVADSANELKKELNNKI